MNKQEFLAALQQRLAGLPEADVRRSLDYYSEMIDDRMEDGIPEAEAVQAIGSMDDVVAQILMETSLPKLVKAKVKRNRGLTAGEIILLILGSPIWLPLVLVMLVLLLILYLLIWLAVMILYLVDLSLAATAITGFITFFVQTFGGQLAQGAFCLGCGLTCAGLSVLMFFGCNLAAKGVIIMTKKLFLGIKSSFIGKGDAL